jgi:hypothetical protein
MKKRGKKKREGGAVTTKAEAPTAPAVKIAEYSGPMPPEIVRQEAEEELDKNFLGPYIESMHVLREKGWSYREIAEWLSERGIEVDHNSVYRAYREWAERRGMDNQAAQADDYRSEMEEQEGR